MFWIRADLEQNCRSRLLPDRLNRDGADLAGGLREPRKRWRSLALPKEGCSRRTARRITARAWEVVRDDVDKVGLENPEMASLLIHQLQTIAAQGLETNQLGSAVAATRELAALLGIGKNNQRGHPTHYYRR